MTPPQSESRRLQSKVSSTIVKFWEQGQLVYRRNPASEDPYGERVIFLNVGCIIDVPFMQGTLAASSRQAGAFVDSKS
jgi:hypothetical protein